MRVGCCSYSYRNYLGNYRDPIQPKPGTMSLDDFLEKSWEMGLDGVELTAYYFPSVEIDYLNHLKRLACRLGLHISAAAVGNSFCLATAQERAGQVQLVEQWIDHALQLGAPCLRVFAGAVPQGSSEAEAMQWVVECLQECGDYAAERGVLLALENHGGITARAEQVLQIIHRVDREWVRVNLDTGNYRTAAYADIEATVPHAVTAHVKTHVHTEGGGREELDYAEIVSVLAAVDYRGYLAIEYEEEEDPMVAVPRFAAELKKLV